MSVSKPNIVVIGASFAGIGLSQKILASIPNVKLTLINTSKEWYFNIAAPRILAKPNPNDLEKVILPIKEHFFSKYPASMFEFIHAAATGLDTGAKTVFLNNSQSISYDYLVIATGSYTPAVESGIPVKTPITDTLRSDIQSAQTKIANASTIAIGGGGAVSIELASEIAEAYPKKKVTVICSSSRLLPMLGEKASKIALKKLKKLGVEVLLDVKALGKNDDGKDGSVGLDNGKVIEADLYIPATGVIPNNSFIPPALLDASGYLTVNAEHKVLEVSGVYGIGDIASVPRKMAVVVGAEIPIVVANLKDDIEKTGKRKQFKLGPISMVVPIGAKGGVAEMGDLGGIVLWSWIVRMIKGNYFISMALMISGLKKQ